MRSIIFGLAVAMLPWAAQAGETVTYTARGSERWQAQNDMVNVRL